MAEVERRRGEARNRDTVVHDLVNGAVDGASLGDSENALNGSSTIDHNDVFDAETPGNSSRTGTLQEGKVDAVDRAKCAELRLRPVIQVEPEHLYGLVPMSFYNLTLHERRRRSTDASVVAQEEQDQDLTPVVSWFVT